MLVFFVLVVALKMLDERIDSWKNKNVIICGDMNLDLIRHEEHQDTQEYIAKMQENGFCLKIRCPIRITTKTATCIDHIATNQETECDGAIVVDISDHLPVLSILKGRKLNTGISTHESQKAKIM